MEKITYTGVRYDIREGFYVEITPAISEKEKMYQFYLCHEDYGIKTYMYGLLLKHIESEEHIISIISNTIDDYIDAYRDEFIQD